MLFPAAGRRCCFACLERVVQHYYYTTLHYSDVYTLNFVWCGPVWTKVVCLGVARTMCARSTRKHCIHAMHTDKVPLPLCRSVRLSRLARAPHDMPRESRHSTHRGEEGTAALWAMPGQGDCTARHGKARHGTRRLAGRTRPSAGRGDGRKPCSLPTCLPAAVSRRQAPGGEGGGQRTHGARACDP